jgi:acetyl-CoA C-acetyltransferase
MKAQGFHDSRGVGATYDGVVILGGKRTPFGAFCQALGRVNPIDLGIIAARAALAETGVPPEAIDQIVFANVAQSGTDAYYLPRHIGLYCGIPAERPALLVQRICGSGLEAIIHAAEQICLGKADIVLAGGAESMTLNPVAAYGLRLGHELGKPGFVDTLWATLFDPAAGCTMGDTAENLAVKYGISREEIDVFAISSQEKYQRAKEAGFFAGEIAAVKAGALEAPGVAKREVRLQPKVEEVSEDGNPRVTTLEKLAKLPPVFRKDGVQTAGNSSGIVDGAAAVIVASEDAARKLGAAPLGRLLASASAGVAPEVMGIGPVPAVRLMLERSGMQLDGVDCIEVNEAFGAQCLAVAKELGVDLAKLNVNGGAIAIGHPLAATGTRLSLTLLRQLAASGGKCGIASACIGGGQGTALLLAPA